MRKADQKSRNVLICQRSSEISQFFQPFSPLSRHVAIQEIGPKKKKQKNYCYTYSICIIYRYYGLQIYSNMATHNTCLTQAWRCDIRFLRKESISRRPATYSQVPLKKIFRDAIQRTRRSGFARSLLNLHISNMLHNIGISRNVFLNVYIYVYIYILL